PACAFSRVPYPTKCSEALDSGMLMGSGNVIGEGKFTRQFNPDLPCNSLLQHGPRAMETCLDSFAPKAKELCGFLHCQIVNHAGNQNASESLGKVFNRPFQNRVDLMLRDRALRIAVLER